MSTDIRYHVVNPQKQSDTYGEFDTVDFVMSNQGRSLVGGSVRLLGNVIVTGCNVGVCGDNVSINQLLELNVKYDGFVGSHSWIDRINTSSNILGTMENIENYARFVGSKAKASLTKEDLFNSNYVCENRVPTDEIAQKLLLGMVDPNYDDSTANQIVNLWEPLDFSVLLDCCMNNLEGSILLPFNKIGDITLSLTLSRNLSIMWGNQNIGGIMSFQLSNLSLMYQTVNDNGQYAKQYVMKVKSSLKQEVASSFASIQTKVPIVADALFMNFIKTSHENTYMFNSLQCERLPEVTRVEYLWNDATNTSFTYDLNSEEEYLSNYISAISKVANGVNNCAPNVLASNDSWGIGLSFGQFINLANTKVGVNITSNVLSTDPYTCYMFFTGLLSF